MLSRWCLSAGISRPGSWGPWAAAALFCLLLAWGAWRENAATAQSATPRSAGKMAVVDLHEVARQLGERERLQARLDAKQAELNERLSLLQKGYAEQVETRKSELGASPGEQDRKELERFTAQLNAQILQERQVAQSEYTRYQEELEQEFAERVRPIALDWARERGFSVLMTSTEVFAFDRSVDLTPAIIETLRVLPEFSGPAPAAAPVKPRIGAAQPGGGSFRANDR